MAIFLLSSAAYSAQPHKRDINYTYIVQSGAFVCSLGGDGNGGNNCIPTTKSDNNDPGTNTNTVQAYASSQKTAMAGSFQDNGDGTVTDTKTHLTWKRCSEGQSWTGTTCNGEAEHGVWSDAMPNEQQAIWETFAGYGDWRIPTEEELLTLLQCGNNNQQSDACIDSLAFPNTPAKGFWTATLNADKLALVADFSFGIIIPNPRISRYYIRLVRKNS